MKCREFTEFLMAYLDGELAEGARDEFDFHLHSCPPCVTYLESYQATVEIGKTACSEEQAIPEDVPEALVQAILAARGK